MSLSDAILLFNICKYYSLFPCGVYIVFAILSFIVGAEGTVDMIVTGILLFICFITFATLEFICIKIQDRKRHY